MYAAASFNMWIDGPWCGQIGAWAALSVAVGSGSERVMVSIDLTEPIETPSDLIVRTAPDRIAPFPSPDLAGIFEQHLLQDL